MIEACVVWGRQGSPGEKQGPGVAVLNASKPSSTLAPAPSGTVMADWSNQSRYLPKLAGGVGTVRMLLRCDWAWSGLDERATSSQGIGSPLPTNSPRAGVTPVCVQPVDLVTQPTEQALCQDLLRCSNDRREPGRSHRLPGATPRRSRSVRVIVHSLRLGGRRPERCAHPTGLREFPLAFMRALAAQRPREPRCCAGPWGVFAVRGGGCARVIITLCWGELDSTAIQSTCPPSLHALAHCARGSTATDEGRP